MSKYLTFPNAALCVLAFQAGYYLYYVLTAEYPRRFYRDRIDELLLFGVNAGLITLLKL